VQPDDRHKLDAARAGTLQRLTAVWVASCRAHGIPVADIVAQCERMSRPTVYRMVDRGRRIARKARAPQGTAWNG
jgi:antitoxin (DNA-binding transcriptional repressor) of toxin-antitoxin stability system